MEEKVNLQHVQLPNNMTTTGDLEPKDLLVYVCIKKYMNKDTKECFPALTTISELSGISVPTIRKTIDKLKQLKYITVRKEGRKNVYKFNSHKNFEPFSYAFLEKTDLTPNEKAYLIVSQQYMFKDIDGYGKITYTDNELADKVNVSSKTISRVNKTLQEKGYLDIAKTNTRDALTGVPVVEKMFHLTKLEQAIVFTLQNHEKRIDKNEQEIDVLKRQVAILLNENKQLKRNVEDASIIEL